MNQNGKFWKKFKFWMRKMGKRDTVQLNHFFQLLKMEQDKTTSLPLPDFYRQVAAGLKNIEKDGKDRPVCFSFLRQTLPWTLVTAGVIFVIIAVWPLYVPFSPKLGVDEALFVLTPEVIILEDLSEAEELDSNSTSLIPDSKSGAQKSIKWSNKICMLKL